MKSDNVVTQSAGKILLVSCVSLLMICISYVFASRIVERQMQTNAETSLMGTEVAIDSHLRGLTTTFFGASLFIRKMLHEGKAPEDLRPYFKEFYDESLRTSKSEVDSSHFIYGYIGKKFISFWEPPPSFLAQRRPWFEAAMRNPGEITVTQPYMDERTGKFVISLAKCLENDGGGTYDLLGMDINADELSETIAKIHLDQDGYGLLLTPDLMFITHFDKKHIGDYLWNIGPTQALVAEQLQKGIDSIARFETTDSAGLDIIAFYKRMANGWYLCVTMPRWAYYRDVHLMACFLGMAGCMLIAFTSYFIIRLSMEKSKAEKEGITKTNFLAKMSHEIRTPLNSIIGMTEILIRKIDVKEHYEIYEYVSIIQQSGKSLLAIINDILDFSKITSGSLWLREEKYSFASLMNDVVNIASMQIIDHKAIDFIVHADADIPYELFGDEARVRQILVNLLSNAIKYTNFGFVRLDVKLEKLSKDAVILSLGVKDTGVGIREEDQKTIFSEFRRVDSGFNQKTEGTGLGLPIVQNLCHLMGGDIKVVSKYGSGSEFTATIRQLAASSEKLASLTEPGQMRVLIFKELERMHESIIVTMKELGVPEPKSVTQRCDFIREFVTGIYDYAFIPSRYALHCFRACEQQCFEACQKDTPRTQLVVMAPLGDVVAIPGVGSITMPVYCVPLANVMNGASSPASHARSQDVLPRFSAPSATVLVVDDVATNLRVAKEFIACYDINIETCMDGFEALAMIESKRYDLIFMDHMMPKMNGLEATLRIRQLGKSDEYFQNVPIVALTANAVVGQKEIFLKHGFNDFLPKPIEVQALDAVLKKWMPPEKQLAADEAVHSDRTAAPNVQQGVVKGLDVEKGIKNVGGRKSAYADVLSIFRQDCEKQTYQLRMALAGEDLPSYAVSAHALKGSLRTIGAEQLAFSAMALENAATKGDVGFLKEETQFFLEELQTLVNAFGLVTPGLGVQPENGIQSGGEAAKAEVSPLKLDALKKALNSKDVRAVNDLLAEYQNMALTSGQRKLVGEMDMLIMAFEFEEAVKKIDSYLT
ncbi:MAG: response regulator [Desulfovibrio sp.]|jgi:signal transduction histidine kinase/CheY-like chemotaxis protein|nr:response regulator [Desulfovibrio sp.]